MILQQYKKWIRHDGQYKEQYLEYDYNDEKIKKA